MVDRGRGGGDDLHREVLLRCLAPQLGAASDVGVLDPCRVDAYVRASVGHRAAVVAAGVALTLADAPLLPVAVLDDALPELFDDLARADDAGLLVPADDEVPAYISGGQGADGPVATPEAPAVPPGIGGGRPANAPLSEAPAVPPGAGPSDLVTPEERPASPPSRAARADARRPFGRGPPR